MLLIYASMQAIPAAMMSTALHAAFMYYIILPLKCVFTLSTKEVNMVLEL